MQIPATTDIMTFPSDDAPGGDIVISVPQADRQRLDDGWDLPSELRFLVTHGALHLAGWDDATSEQRDRDARSAAGDRLQFRSGRKLVQVAVQHVGREEHRPALEFSNR